ncbi:MAG: CBS domain-containing protein [Candidatus Altiarchaeota archaeon]
MRRNISKYSNVRGSGDRGPREFKSIKPKRVGSLMHIATKDVITTHPENSIKNVSKLMEEHDFRRIPVTDAGTSRLEGLVVAMDILDFLGGGKKYNIIVKDYQSNFLSAINCPIRKIMREPSYLTMDSDIHGAVEIMVTKKTSAIPVVDNDDSMKVIAIVTESDVLPEAVKIGVEVKDAMQENPITSTLGMMVSDVSKVMVRNQIRRLPVIREDKLIGVVTQFDILRFLGKGNFKSTDVETNLSTRVDEIMEKKVVSVAPRQDLSEVIKLMKKTGLGGFPVVEKGRLVGIITSTDVIREAYEAGRLAEAK